MIDLKLEKLIRDFFHTNSCYLHFGSQVTAWVFCGSGELWTLEWFDRILNVSDIDECHERDFCDKNSTFCLNNPGSFECHCYSGFFKPAGSTRACQGILNFDVFYHVEGIANYKLIN